MTYSDIESWMNFSKLDDEKCFVAKFEEHFLGNMLIRSLHGGVVGIMIELVAEAGAKAEYQDAASKAFEVTSSNVNYLRVTKDADLFARYNVIRIGKRVAFVDVSCWQDGEELLVAKGSCVVRILDKAS